MEECRREVPAQARQNGFRLRVAKACVELNDINARATQGNFARRGRNHQARVKNAAISNATTGEFLDDRDDNRLANLAEHILRNDGRGGIRSHPACIRTFIAIKNALVVLGRREQHDILAIRHRQDGALLAVQKLLNQDFRPRRAKLSIDEHIINGLLRLFARLSNNHALAGGESVRLNDDGESVRGECRLRGSGVRKDFRTPRRNMCRVHNFLSKALRAFHPCPSRDGTKGGHAQSGEAINETRHEGGFGTHHDEVGLFLRDPRGNAVNIFRTNRDNLRERGNSCVAWRTIKFVPRRILREPPHERMFASATTNYENLHCRRSFYFAGIFRVCPMRSLSDVSPLSSLIRETVVLQAWAIKVSVSPLFTV